MTPETIRNDLESGMAPINDIVLIVFDEAHRASGNYAYVEIVNLMKEARAVFRVLALSATPGNDTQKVQLVVDNLLIQALQLRSEEALDVAPYTHHREIIELVIPPTKELQELVAMFGKIIQPFLQKLVSSKVFTQDNPLMVRPFALISRRDAWRRTKNTLPPSLQGMIEGYFAISISMCSHLEKLMGWGIKSFYEDIVGFDREVKQSNKPSKLRQGVVNSAPFIALLAKTDAYVKSKVSSHPKMDKLVELVLEHFKQNEETAEDDGQPTETRIMVFGAYRSVVEEMVETLGQHGPLIRPTIFVGQAKKAGSKSGGMRQKEQLKVLQDFKHGTFNVLCATSIGEEGLDIGDIDLIICYDVNKSPIRMLQRSGRTGRKRKGKIILLLGQGNDESSVKKARAQYKNVQKSINSSKIQVYGGEQSSLITTETISCIMENFEIAVKKPVLKHEKCSLKLEPLMNSDRLDLYSKKYFQNGYSIPSFTNYSHWQVSQLKILQTPHGTLSKLFTNMMETLEKLKETENADLPSRSSKSRLTPNFLAIEPRINKGDIESRSDDDFIVGAKRKIPSIDSNSHLHDRVVTKKKVLMTSSETSEFERIPGDPLNHNVRPDTNSSSNNRDLNILRNDLEGLIEREKFDDEKLKGEIDQSSYPIDNMVHDEIAIESLRLDFYPQESVFSPAPVKVPEFPSSPEQQLHSSLSEYDSFLNELDGIDFNELDNTVNQLVKNEQGYELSPIITKISKISKSRRRVIISSSNHGTSPLAVIDENRVPDGAKGRNSKMNQSAFNTFVDYEVEVSGTESDDETTEENRDLSGFVVSNPTTPHNTSASFYRKKRLSPLHAGYKFRKGYEIKPKTFTNKDYHYDDQEIDIPSSLKSFVVEDQVIDYQTQRYDPLDFDDEDIDQGFN